MKPITSFKRGVAKARRDWQEGRCDVALSNVSDLLEEWPDNPQLLVMWADLTQLQEQSAEPDLENAAAAYRRAADLEGDLPAALVELGHYYYSIKDDAKAANKTFDKAIVACRRLLIEALLAKAKALQEMQRASEARACLEEAYMLQLRNPHRTDLSKSFEETIEQLNGFLHAG